MEGGEDVSEKAVEGGENVSEKAVKRQQNTERIRSEIPRNGQQNTSSKRQ